MDAMNRDDEIRRFKWLLGRATSTGEDLGLELQKQRTRLEAAGLDAGEINDIIHDRQSRATYKPYPAPTETPLKVPFSEKDQAKALGARWSPNQKIWVVPAGTDLNKFKKWR